MVKPVVMTLMLFVALGCFAYLMIPRMRLLWSVRGEDRFNHFGARFLGTLKFAIGQWRMPREPIAGLAHIFIFSGFLIVAIATIEHFVHAYIPGWHLPGLGGKLGQFYTAVKDYAEMLVIVAALYGLWRRLKPTESRVGRSWEGVFVLVMILVLMVTDFMVSGAALIAHGQHLGVGWEPGGAVAMMVMRPLGGMAAEWMGEAAYWIHCAAVLVFLNFLPIGKHFHVITGIPNVFFKNFKPYGQVEKIDFEAEEESFGVRSTQDLSWKMVLDLYSCTECGRCEMFCPTVVTGKPLAHRQLNRDLKQALFDDQEGLLAAQEVHDESIPSLVGGKINPDTIWACTSCGSCEQECPVFIENVPRIIEMRQEKVMMQGDITPELARAYKGMENNSNPWGLGFDKRDAWAEGLDVPRFSDFVSHADASQNDLPLLYWVGCAGAFDDRSKKITLAMVKILNAAGVPFGILGKEEGCTGDAARRTGNEYLFQELATRNVELLNKYGVGKILTHCPHCLHTIKREYPQFGGNYEVIHHTQLLESLLEEGRLNLRQDGVSKPVTYHDACYLGRYHGIYDAPRTILEHLPQADLVELPRHKSRSFCCGAGGGRFWMEETIGERINVHRAQEVVDSDCQTVASNCPFCLTMLRDGLNDLEKEKIITQDLAEMVADALVGDVAIPIPVVSQYDTAASPA